MGCGAEANSEDGNLSTWNERYPGKTSLPGEDHALVRAVQPGAVDSAAEIGDIHALAGEHDPDRFFQITHQRLTIGACRGGRARWEIHQCAADRIGTAIGPVNHAP